MAIVRNIGAAQDVAQVDTITVANVWAADDTVSVTIDKQTLIMTCGSTIDTTAEVAAGLAEVLNLRTHDATKITADVTVNFGGWEAGREVFQDIVATVSGSVVSCTSATPGQPYVMAVTETTAGSGTATEATATAATGKNFFDNIDNWEGGAVPSQDDTINLDSTSASILYALNNVITGYNFETTPDCTAEIGLPKTNVRGYTEYRQRFFDAPNNASPTTQTAELRGTGTLRIDYGTVTPTAVNVHMFNSAAETLDGAGLQIVGGKTLTLRAFSGSMSVSNHPGETASEITSLNNLGDARITVGESATFINTVSSVTQQGGHIDLHADCVGGSNEIRVYGGTLVVHTTATLNFLYIFGGRCDMRGGSVQSPTCYAGGELDFSSCPISSIGGKINLYKGYTYRDPAFVNAAFDLAFIGCSPRDGQLYLKNNVNLSQTGALVPALG